jgi:hypothetical protein
MHYHIDCHHYMETMEKIVILLPFLGACLYRWRGMAHPYKKYFPRPFNQIAFALPYAYAAWLVHGLWWVSLLVIVATTLAILTGHGAWMDLGKMPDDDEDETTEFLIKHFKDKLPQYWYDVLGLSMNGLLITASAGIATGNILLLISGITKAPAYMIADKINKGTEGGEFLTGLFLYGALVWLMF